MSHSVTPRTTAHQAPLSMEIYSQEYWSGLPFPTPGHVLTQGLDPGLRVAGTVFTIWQPGTPNLPLCLWTSFISFSYDLSQRKSLS